MGGGFCDDLLSFHEVVVLKDRIGILMVCLGIIYLLMSVIIIYFIKLQEHNAKAGNDSAVRSVIFPVFVNVLWVNAAVNIFIGFVALSFTFAPYHDDPDSVYSFSVMYGLQHLVTEGVALLLMQKGLGVHAARQALQRALLWGGVTLLTQSLVYTQDATTSFAVSMVWQSSLLVFYSCLWFTPQKHLYRRPAAIFYAQTWVVYRAISMGATIMYFIPATHSVGNCVFVFGSLFPFAVLEPVLMYYTLLQDSMWWQGMDIRQGRRQHSAEEIRSPLQGIDLNLKAAQTLAASVDKMAMLPASSLSYLSSPLTSYVKHTSGDSDSDIERSIVSRSAGPALSSSSSSAAGVRLLNFAYISMDKKSQLGSGSFSRVYRGRYKQQQCAIKLIFTVDLTLEVIKRIAAEAQLLSMIRHPNVVDILGVAVLPPSVCILLELCSYGSLGDLLKNNCAVMTSSSINRFTLLTESGLDNSANITPAAMLSFINGFNHDRGGQQSAVVEQGATTLGSSSSNSTSISFDFQLSSTLNAAKHPRSPHRPPVVLPLELQAVSLSWTDRLYLAVGCARGLVALHTFSPDLCHRDVKSFNFLVDHQLNAKISDLELGMAELLKETMYVDSSSSSSSSVGQSGRKSPSYDPNHKDKGRDRRDDSLQGDQILANWAAPEVIERSLCTQASDIYSFGLVLWEILVGSVPYSDIKWQDKIREYVVAGGRPCVPVCVAQGRFEQYVDLMRRAWSHDPAERPTAVELLAELETMWTSTAHISTSPPLLPSTFSDDSTGDESLSLHQQPPPSSFLSQSAANHHAAGMSSDDLSVRFWRQLAAADDNNGNNSNTLSELDSAGEPWLILSPQPPHVIVWASTAWCSCFGHEVASIRGKHLNELHIFDTHIYMNDPEVRRSTKDAGNRGGAVHDSGGERWNLQSCLLRWCGSSSSSRPGESDAASEQQQQHENAVNTALFLKSISSKRISKSRGCHAVLRLMDSECRVWMQMAAKEKRMDPSLAHLQRSISNVYSLHAFPIYDRPMNTPGSSRACSADAHAEMSSATRLLLTKTADAAVRMPSADPSSSSSGAAANSFSRRVYATESSQSSSATHSCCTVALVRIGFSRLQKATQLVKPVRNPNHSSRHATSPVGSSQSVHSLRDAMDIISILGSIIETTDSSRESLSFRRQTDRQKKNNNNNSGAEVEIIRDISPDCWNS